MSFRRVDAATFARRANIALLAIASSCASSSVFAQQELLPIAINDVPSAQIGQFVSDVQPRATLSAPQSLPTSAAECSVIQLAPLPGQIEQPVITALSLSGDGKFMAVSGDDHAIRIVELANGKTIATMMAHLDWVQSLAFSPTDQYLASCGNDGSIRVWNMVGKPTLTIEQSVPHALYTLVFATDDRLYAAGFGNKIYSFDVADNLLRLDHQCECRDIRSLACSPDHRVLAYGGRDGVLRIRSLGDSRTAFASHTVNQSGTDVNTHDDPTETRFSTHFERIRTVQFANNGRSIYSVGEDRRIVEFDLESQSIRMQLETTGGKLHAMCPIDEQIIAVSGSDNSIRLIDTRTSSVVGKLIGHDGSVSILKRTPTHLISGSFDTTIRLWNIKQFMSQLDSSGRFVHPVAAQFEDSGAEESIR